MSRYLVLRWVAAVIEDERKDRRVWRNEEREAGVVTTLAMSCFLIAAGVLVVLICPIDA